MLVFYPGGLQVLAELVHSGVGDAHVPEHAFQFRRELTTTLGLQHRKYQRVMLIVNSDVLPMTDG